VDEDHDSFQRAIVAWWKLQTMIPYQRSVIWTAQVNIWTNS
jgi:hypothetical protein